MPDDESKAMKMTSEPNVLIDQATRTIKTLWANGIIVSHPEEMLHADGLHRFDIKTNIRDEKMASTMRQVLPDVLLMLQGILPKDAKVNT